MLRLAKSGLNLANSTSKLLVAAARPSSSAAADLGMNFGKRRLGLSRAR